MEEVAVARARSLDLRSFVLHRERTAALLWLVLVGGVIAWGRSADLAGAKLHAAPFFGRYGFHADVTILIPVALAISIALGADALVARLPWRRLLVVSAVAAGLWGVSLAVVDGWSALSEPLSSRHEYLAIVDEIGAPGRFLETFVDEIARYPVHVEGHPPGAPLLFWGLDRVGLSGAGPAAVVVVIAWMLVPVAALVAAKEVADETVARRAAPFLVLVPAAVWAITSVDASFAAVSAWGIATFAIATRRDGVAGDIAAALSGLLWGSALLLSYGVAPLGATVLALAALGRRLRPLLVAGAVLATVLALVSLAGFWWPDGLSATVERYSNGVASARPWWFFVVANLAVFAVAIGPASIAGLARWRGGGIALLVGAALVAVMVSDLSGLSKGEVERIWLPFVPWVVLGTAWLLGRARKGWLLAQASVAIAVQTLVITPW